MSDTNRTNEPAKRVGLIVVHGVGEAQLGYSVNTLTYALKRDYPTYDIVPHSKIMRLDEEPVRQFKANEVIPPPAQFRVVQREATHPSGAKLVLEELYWADLTALPPGRFASLLGMFRLIFESHHFVDAMLDRSRGVATYFLRLLLLAASLIMRGPIAAMTISASLVCILLLYAPPEIGGKFNVEIFDHNLFSFETRVLQGAELALWKFVAVQLSLIAAAAILLRRTFKTKDPSWYDTTFWLGGTSLLLLGLALTKSFNYAIAFSKLFRTPKELKHCISPEYAADCYVVVPYHVIISCWVLWGSIILAAILLSALLSLAAVIDGDRKPIAPIFASVGVIVLQYMLWTVIVVTALFPMLNRGQLITGFSHAPPPALLAEIIKQNPSAQSAEQISTVADSFKYILNTVSSSEKGKNATPLDDIDVKLDPLKSLIHTPQLTLKWIEPFKFMYAFTATALVISILLMGGVYVWRGRLAKRYERRLENAISREAVQTERSVDLPRLVFSPLLLAWLIAAVCIIFALMRDSTLYTQYQDYRPIMLSFGALAAIGFPFLLGNPTANFIHIARDLLDHHFAPSLEPVFFFFGKTFGTLSRHPRRRRIQSRLEQMLKSMCHGCTFDAIIFVGHSQGTIVAFDYLSDNDKLKDQGIPPIGFVTFGSPIGHIYEKYFHEYATTHNKIAMVEDRVVAWTNLNRVDDYIGGTIAKDRPTKIDNHVLGRGGHTGYWDLREIVTAIDQMIYKVLEPVQQKVILWPAHLTSPPSP